MAVNALAHRNYRAEREITGKVSRLYHSSERFSAGILQADDGPIMDRDCRFSVPALLQIDEQVTLTGAWVNDNKYGWQFKATAVQYPMPEATVDGLASYLSNNPAFHGIGPTKARLIADAFGESFDEVLRRDPESVAKLGKLTQVQVETLQREWTARADLNAISSWLAGFGLTHGQIKKIATRYGNKAKSVLENNPYILYTNISGFGFGRTDEIALKMGIPKNHPGRIQACLCHLVQSEANEGGHTWILRKDLIKAAVAKLALDDLNSERLVRSELKGLCENNKMLIGVENADTGEVRIALRALHKMETDIREWLLTARSFATSYNCLSDVAIGNLIDQAASYKAAKLPSSSQRAAVEMVMKNQISVITGSAGTGKSLTIALIKKLYEESGRKVLMCAPTGKAAKRISEHCDGAYASTIHKLLGYNPAGYYEKDESSDNEWTHDPTNNWKFNVDNQLPADLVIVDEVSMADVALLWRLMSAIDFSRTQLLLVGDHEQLPPIGPGNVLRDILTCKLAPVALLTVCFRSSGDLKANCNALLSGHLTRTTSARLENGRREWWMVDSMEDPDLLISQLCNLFSSRLPQWGFHPLNGCIIISPYNKGKLGVIRLNREMQRLWQKHQYGVELPAVTEAEWDKRPRMLAGDKIIQTKNDYKLGPDGTMNGTIGVITAITSNGSRNSSKRYIIQFEDQKEPVEVEIGSEQESNLSLAYAITIHKAQGSEWECVIAVIHRAHTFMLTRNLIYTAATRARKTTILIGDKLGLRRAVRTVKSMNRRTWLSLGKEG